jgi:hypothetical protein
MQKKRQAVIVVDAYSTGAMLAPAFVAHGVQCVHVRSSERLRPALLVTARPGNFELEILYTDDNELCERLRHCEVQWVLAGCEEGVELAAHVAELFQVARRNAARNWMLWRNKHAMHEALQVAGVRSIRHFKSAHAADICRWAESSGVGYPVVVKPIDSAGSDNVHICENAEHVSRAVAAVLGARNALLQPNNVVLAQEYLRNSELLPAGSQAQPGAPSMSVDVEYCVNTVSSEGQHYVSEIVKVYRKRVADAPVHDYNELQCPVQDAWIYEVLGGYTGQVLDALGIRNGVAHSELMVVDNQPVLLETAARLPGGIDLSAYTRTLGTNQLALWVESCLDPAAFEARSQRSRTPLRWHSSCVFLISDREGPVSRQADVSAWCALPSFHSLKLRDSGRLERTNALFNAPGQVFLLHKDKAQIARDRAFLRAAEAEVYASMLHGTPHDTIAGVEAG